MEISKLDAAKRQVDTAVTLFFRNGDPISIHTLTAAAHQVLMDLGKSVGIKSIFKDASLSFIKKDMQDEYLKMINEAENFFKHADRDPKGLLSFNPEQSNCLLYDAVVMYMQITTEQPEDLSIYRAWFLLTHPTLIDEETRKRLSANSIDFNKYGNTTTKTQFYIDVKSSLMKL